MRKRNSAVMTISRRELLKASGVAAPDAVDPISAAKASNERAETNGIFRPSLCAGEYRIETAVDNPPGPFAGVSFVAPE